MSFEITDVEEHEQRGLKGAGVELVLLRVVEVVAMLTLWATGLLSFHPVPTVRGSSRQFAAVQV